MTKRNGSCFVCQKPCLDECDLFLWPVHHSEFMRSNFLVRISLYCVVISVFPVIIGQILLNLL